MTALLPGQVARAPGRVDQSVTYAVNHGLRRDVTRLAAAVATTDPQDRAGWVALERRWAWFVAVLRMQSAGQEDGLWPTLRERGGTGDRRLLASLAAEHDALGAGVEVVAAQLRRLANGPGEDGLHAAAVVRAGGVRDALLHHLEREEAELHPLLQRCLTQREWLAVDREFYLGRMSGGFVLRLVPWVAHGLSPEALEEVLQAAGGPFRVLLRLTRPGFERRERRVLGVVR